MHTVAKDGNSTSQNRMASYCILWNCIVSQPETRQGIQRASIDDLESADAAGNLSVRQLKEILVNNFVDYRGCCEKHELVDRVRRLWVETQANRKLGQSNKRFFVLE